ncbi:MAG: DUF4215 domain-containing protein, partial [Myxococcales bacterium]|nr:DUF4215 domain-containing protein [Myxococcales bacterium]
MSRVPPWSALALLVAANTTCCPDVVPTGSYLDAVRERCGNGSVDTEDEECDDGEQNGDDAACTATCKIGYCGDGLIIDGAEECDDGAANGPSASCSETCVAAACGDGIVQPGEECDLGDGNEGDVFGGGCSLECRVIPGCGDGFLDAPIEECDDGNHVDGDDCTNACTVAECGDGIVREGAEACDDGNTVSTDACVDCQLARCGDGVVHEGVEECDGADDCNDACIRDRVVFVTSETQTGLFSVNDAGLAAADSFCRSRALGAGFDVQEHDFWAWMSDSETSPAQRFHRSPGRYVRMDGTVIAESWDDLTDGELLAPLEITEKG